MKIRNTILLFLISLTFTRPAHGQSNLPGIRVEFSGTVLNLPFDRLHFVDFGQPLSDESIQAFYTAFSEKPWQPLVKALLEYREQAKLDDWLYYQLIRRTAEQISPKASNYHRYTLYKWFLLAHSGYDATLTIADDQLLFYVQSDENIYNIPARIRDGKQYVCLNYHDYGSIDFARVRFEEISLRVPGVHRQFSYKVRQLPDFNTRDYQKKDLQFTYYQHQYHFKLRLNPQVKALFNNYPVVDYESYFNIPLSRETYSSLVPAIRTYVKNLSQKNGIDYLMRFTREAFAYQPDLEHFGAEKRLPPEQTLLYDQSDCEDRAALFFFLVKEIYNLPMIVLAFPEHVTVAVKLDKPAGKPILHNGVSYSVCEPTPQKRDLALGQMLPELRNRDYEVAYVYEPERNK